MSRLLLGACAVLLLVGCAKAFSSFAGGAAGEPQSLPQTRTCGPARTPPIPLVRARRVGDRIRVEYELARPANCAPDAILVSANSVEKIDNVAPSPTNGLIRVTGTEGTVDLELPPLDLPPYEVRASTVTPSGARSKTTAVVVPADGDYCLQDVDVATCVRRAQAKYERCLRGAAPRGECPAYVWRTLPPIPYEPVQGVTRAGLEQSFTSLLRTTEPRGSVQCSSTRACLVNGVVTFAVSGYQQRPGCWIAEHRLLRHRACVDWEWNP